MSSNSLEKAVARVEALLKGLAFDCHSCGQCVLSRTGMICPMTCPKGLRNGPCGGTLEGKCEVYPDKECVWARIHKRTGKGSHSLPVLIPSPDASLFWTSSYLNYLSGRDKDGRTPLNYLDLPANRTQLPRQTDSLFEKRLKEGRFVKTGEIRAPREGDFTQLRETAELLRDHFDAVNATAYLNAKPSIPSAISAAELVKLGVEPISQATCRDHTKTSFVSEMILNRANGVNNTLCLTGDSYAGSPRIKQVFDMDSALMLYEARYMREKGAIRFTGETLKNPPRPFLGAAINPFTTPANVPIRRLKQKAAAGADFIQTQLIFDLPGFAEFMKLVCQENLDKEVFILAGVPVVISKKAFSMLPQVPGVRLPHEVFERLNGAADFREEGLRFARELIEAIQQVPGVAGVHLMLFGADHSVLPELVRGI